MAHSVEVPNYAEIAAIYESYSQACLAAGDFATSNSLSVINALFLCAVYHHSRDDTADSHKGSILLGIAFKLAITVRYLTHAKLRSDILFLLDGTSVGLI